MDISYLNILIISFLLNCGWKVSSVDRNNFKTCQQSSFCRRHRALQPGVSNYEVLMNTLRTSDHAVSVDVINKQNQVLFMMKIYTLEDSTFRIKFNEKKPLYPRFEEPYALLNDIKNAKFKVEVPEKSSAMFKITAGDNTAVITGAPLRIDFYKGQIHAVSFNSRGLFKFEHHRYKPGSAEYNEKAQDESEGANEQKQPEEEVPVEEESDTDGLWEETYKGHTDSKPRGPSSLGADIAFIHSQHVYGIPEHADSLKLKNTDSGDPYRLYNLDVFEYEIDNPMALYGSVPVMVSHSKEITTGIFWHNAAETWIDIKHLPDRNVVDTITEFFSSSEAEVPQVSTHWMSESGIIDLFVMLGNRPMDVFRQYARLTGTTPLPPLFSLGYHQCRWNYNDMDDVRQVHENFDKNQLSVDVLWLDIEHTDGKRYFTWDEHKFPDPIGMTNNLTARGRKLVVIVDPHIKRDSNYFFYEENRAKGFYIKNKDGEEFDGWCWPGSSSYIDFTNKDARDFYSNTFQLDRFKGSTLDTFIWNDMNEPSVFNGPEVTLHKDALHPGIDVEHREIHNVNGMLFHSATYDGLLKRSSGRLRPFVLTRAHYAGTQRTAAVWTGDNAAEWGHLRISVPMILSQSITGITHIGADIGGFFGNPTPELLSRWYQAAAFTTFFRAHAHIDTKRREPWLFGEPTLSIVRESISDHYRLLPYIYTLFYENELTGAPPMRPMWVEFPSDEVTFGMDSQYLLGPAMLIRPIVDEGSVSASVYFPDGLWYDWKNRQTYTGPSTQTVEAPLDKIPVYQHGGTIVPRKERPRRSSTLMRNDPFTYFVALDSEGKAEGALYVDDEHTMDYKQGKYLYTHLTFKDGVLTSAIIDPNGSYNTKSWLERVVIYGLKKAPAKVALHSDVIGSLTLVSTFMESKDNVASCLTIRRPGINIGIPFTITLVQ